MNTEKIAVIGLGTIGCSVAADLILHGLHVLAVDTSPTALAAAQVAVRDAARFAPMLDPALPKRKASELASSIVYSDRLEGLADCQFVIENVSEDWNVKKALYLELDRLCAPEAPIGVNTSCLSITKLAALIQRPERVVGMHFMNPSYLKPVIEVMRGFHTSDACLQAAESLLARLDKTAVVVNDLPGFVSNRISHLFMNEAAFVVQDQVADAAQVDKIFRDCFGHKMGPLETADLIGLDTVVKSLDVLYESYQDSKFRCCPMLRKMTHAGLLGKKSGQGFYNYREGAAKTANPDKGIPAS